MMEQDLVEAEELLQKAAAFLENAGWPGYAMEIADMANAIGALPYRRRRMQRPNAALSELKP